jgi:hypothetical protein
MGELYLCVDIDKSTGLYFGCLYIMRVCSKGIVRNTRLGFVQRGFDTEYEAAAAANNVYVNVPKIDLSKCSREGIADICLPAGGKVTLIKPQDDSKPGQVVVRVPSGKLVDVSLSFTQVERLACARKIVKESEHGYNPELSATYTHYRVIEGFSLQ